MFEEGLEALVTNDSGVSALASKRVYPIALPLQPTLPAINWAVTARAITPILSGSDGPVMKRVKFGCWGNTYSDARALVQALHNLLDGFSGPLPDGTIVQEVESDNEVDMFESDARQYCTVCDFLFWF